MYKARKEKQRKRRTAQKILLFYTENSSLIVEANINCLILLFKKHCTDVWRWILTAYDKYSNQKEATSRMDMIKKIL